MSDLVQCPVLVGSMDPREPCPLCCRDGRNTGFVTRQQAAAWLLDNPPAPTMGVMLQDNTLERVFTDALFPALVPDE